MGIWSADAIFFFSLNKEERKKAAKTFFISYALFGVFVILLGLYFQNILIILFSIFPFLFAFYIYDQYIKKQRK
jgi:fatty acid desaturase